MLLGADKIDLILFQLRADGQGFAAPATSSSRMTSTPSASPARSATRSCSIGSPPAPAASRMSERCAAKRIRPSAATSAGRRRCCTCTGSPPRARLRSGRRTTKTRRGSTRRRGREDRDPIRADAERVQPRQRRLPAHLVISSLHTTELRSVLWCSQITPSALVKIGLGSPRVDVFAGEEGGCLAARHQGAEPDASRSGSSASVGSSQSSIGATRSCRRCARSSVARAAASRPVRARRSLAFPLAPAALLQAGRQPGASLHAAVEACAGPAANAKRTFAGPTAR